MQGKSACPSPIGSSPVLGPRSADDEPSQLDLGAADSAVAEVAKRLGADLRKKEQALAALEAVLQEREEELREKEQAHAQVCRQATLMEHRNAELTSQFDVLREELDGKKAEVWQLTAELHRKPPTGADPEALATSAMCLPAEQVTSRKIHDAEITCIAAATGQVAPLPPELVVVGTVDGSVKLLHATSIRPHAQLRVSRDLVRSRIVCVDVWHSGLLLAAASDYSVRVLDLNQQKLRHTLRGHLGAVGACGFMRGGAQAFTASADRTVKIWDLERGQTILSVPAASALTAAHVHQNSEVIVTGHADGAIALCDPRSGDLTMTSPVHQGRSVAGVCLSPRDGRTVLSQAEDGVMKVTLLETMRTQLTLDGLGPVVGPSPPAFSPCGTHLLGRGGDKLGCWHTSGDCVYVHDAPGAAAVCWKLPTAISVHKTGAVLCWGSPAGRASFKS